MIKSNEDMLKEALICTCSSLLDEGLPIPLCAEKILSKYNIDIKKEYFKDEYFEDEPEDIIR